MDELTLLRDFFKAWEGLHAIPKRKGPHSLEQKAAAELLVSKANLVRSFQAGHPDAPIPSPAISQAAQDYLGLRSQIQAIPPQDTRVNKATTEIG